MGNLNTQPNNRSLSSSCSSCERMTVIEGEYICFIEGKIIGLTQISDPSPKPKLICDGWKIGKLHF